MKKTTTVMMLALIASLALAGPAPVTNETGQESPAGGLDDRWIQYCAGYTTYWYGDFAGQGLGVKFTPNCYPVRLDSVSFWFQNSVGSYPWRLVIYDDDGTGGYPGTVIWDTVYDGVIARNNWNSFYVGHKGIQTTSGSFYVYMYYMTLVSGRYYPYMGLDNNGRSSPNPNWYDADTGGSHHFRQYTDTNHDLMIRAWVYDIAGPSADVGVKWLSPVTGTYDSTASITPACSVYNRGTGSATFPVRMKIGSTYNQTTSVSALAAGATRYVTFPAGANWPLGTLTQTCTTELTGDGRNGNDTMLGSITTRWLDGAAVAIARPVGYIDSGAVVTPQCTVRNNGTLTSVSTRMYWTGYSRDVSANNMARWATQALNYTNWTAALPRGTYTATCTTRLSGDMVQANNRVTSQFTIRVIDVQPFTLVAPPATVESGAVVAPACSVRNNSNVDVPSFDVLMSIGAYADTQTVTNLAAGASQLVTFDNWTAPGRGSYAITCSTLLATDRYASNDTLSGSVDVGVADIAVTGIVGPSGSLDSGSQVTPQAVVQNLGTGPATFNVRFAVGSYADTQAVTGLAAGAVDTVDFALWTATGRGSFGTTCSTMLNGDAVQANNQQTGTVTLNVHDIGTTAITTPPGAVPPGTVTPAATFHNYGTMREACNLHFNINSTPPYAQQVSLPAGLPLGADTSVSFPNWNATPGSYTATCFTTLGTDQIPANDTATRAFTVGAVDVGVTAILAPAGEHDTSAAVTPQSSVYNYGDQAATFEVFFTIESAGSSFYSSSRTVTGLASGSGTDVTFDELAKPHEAGVFITRCSTWIANDGNSTNNVLGGSFSFITGPPPSPWQTQSPMPAAPSSKPNKDGAWLTGDGAGTVLYAAKGNKTADFYRYDVANDSWTPLAQWPDGIEAKKPNKGAAGCAADAVTIYAAKGNNTQGFWKYDAAGDSWSQKKDVPLGLTNKKVKGGNDLAHANGFVYLLKGNKNEFWKYDVTNDSWVGLPNAPLGASGKDKYDKGSWLAFDGVNTLYAHKAKYHELFAYDVTLDTWTDATLKGMPFTGMLGKSKKSKDGGSAAFLNGMLYALKGGSTQEFWCYDVAGDSWHELDTVPLMGTYPKKKKVKAGADIAVTGPATLHALKGNKTLEMWKYSVQPVVMSSPSPTRGGVMANRSTGSGVRIEISPNPLASGFATLNYALPSAARAMVRVFDATGRAALARGVAAGRNGSVTLDLRGLATGVYLVRFESAGFSTTRKLVVEH